MGSVSFSICSLLFILIFVCSYFSKKRYDILENHIYSLLLIITLIGLAVDIIGFFTMSAFSLNSFLNIFISKLYVVYLISWIYFLMLYYYVVATKSRKLNKLFIVSYFLAFLIISVLPLTVKNDAGGIYSDGLAVNFGYAVFGICLALMFYFVLTNIKNIKKKEYISLVVLIIFGVLVLFIQPLIPGIHLLITCQSIVVGVMYFTIENPDMRLIAALNAAKNQAEKANKAKTEFLSSMSHEIRTPLNAIVGFSECLISDDGSLDVKEYAKDIVLASHNLLEIVNGILDISKIEANKMDVILKDYHPKEVFENLGKLIMPRIKEKPIDFALSLSPDLPFTLNGDAGKLKQIVLNLLTNAAKYTDSGQIVLDVKCVNDLKNKRCNLFISVKDTGRGIKKEHLTAIFQKFERIDEDKNTTIEGTGLGLAITKSLVEMMGGKISVFSKVNEGSVFHVYLGQDIVKLEGKEEVIEKKENDYSKFYGKKVLIVDDSQINIKVAVSIMKDYKFDIVTCDDGFKALSAVQKDKFDLIFLDIMMPKKNGVETLNDMKEVEGFNSPCIALTADAIEGNDEKYLKAGFDGYLSKPIDRDELYKLIDRFIGGKNE